MKKIEAYSYLSKDPVMAELIKKYGKLEIRKREVNLFEDLVDSIISQQLSVKAAATILKRFQALFNNHFPTPEQLLKTNDDTIRACGISYPKIRYIKGLAEAVVNKQIVLEKLAGLPDEEVLTELISLKGIGKWTAEMILMFSLQRQDVFSIGDMGLKNAIARLYGIDKTNLAAIEELSLTWKPYRTIAARYLWLSLDNTT